MDFLTKTGSRVVVKVVADSVSEVGTRITTFELEYPRIVHSELMTHRLFSRNAMSSRAIPVPKMLEQVINNPAMPVEFGKNKAGMQSDGEHTTLIGDGYTPEEWWKLAAMSAAKFAEAFSDAGYHKQVGNRLIEPFQFMKTIVTATEFNNFFWLRVDEDADPTIRQLATVMKEAYDESVPELLYPGEWHTPYVEHLDPSYCPVSEDVPRFAYGVPDETKVGSYKILTVEEALSISSSCCAQISYRRLDSTKDKALSVYDRLLTGRKVHASPFEHQASPMAYPQPKVYFNGGDVEIKRTDDGLTHIDLQGNGWSGNLKGWNQHRQLLSNHVITG